MNVNELTYIAIKASLKAGKRILEIYNSNDFDIKIKDDNSPLTIADIESNKIISKFLLKTGFPILSEEGKNVDYEIRSKWNKFWLVDPIDGTKEFIKKNGEFTVNIAFVVNQKPIAGVIFAPVLNTLYFSNYKTGSFKFIFDDINTDLNLVYKNAARLPINTNSKHCVVVASRSHMSKETEQFIDSLKQIYQSVKIISKGSSLKMCIVAEGSADYYPRFAPTMEWDTAAGQAICENAGYKVIDCFTKSEMIYNKRKLLNNWFLVEKKK